MELPSFLLSLSAETVLLGFLAFTLIYSFSLPITEEVALILVGIVAHGRDMAFLPVVLACYPGIFGSDIVYYAVSYHFGFRLLSLPFFRKLFKPKKILASERYFKRRGPKISFFCRFILGIRAPCMIAAGFLRMPLRIFAFYDGLAAAISTVLWLFVGYFFGSLLQQGLHTVVFVMSIVGPLFFIGGAWVITRKIAREERAMTNYSDELFARYGVYEEEKISNG